MPPLHACPQAVCARSALPQLIRLDCHFVHFLFRDCEICRRRKTIILERKDDKRVLPSWQVTSAYRYSMSIDTDWEVLICFQRHFRFFHFCLQMNSQEMRCRVSSKNLSKPRARNSRTRGIVAEKRPTGVDVHDAKVLDVVLHVHVGVVGRVEAIVVHVVVGVVGYDVVVPARALYQKAWLNGGLHSAIVDPERSKNEF